MTSHRRQRLDPQERRDQLIAATVDVVGRCGYRGTSADAIVATAGVSKGLLWRYFGGLDDLMEQAARRTLMVIAEDVAAGLDLTAPVPEVIRSAVHAAAGLLHTHPAERRALQEIVINLRTADGSQRLTLDDYEELYAAQEEIFRRGVEQGDLRDTLDPRVAAVTYQGAVDAMLGYLEAHPDLDPDRYADLVADILLGGLRAR